MLKLSRNKSVIFLIVSVIILIKILYIFIGNKLPGKYYEAQFTPSLENAKEMSCSNAMIGFTPSKKQYRQNRVGIFRHYGK